MRLPAYLLCATPRSGSTLLCDLLAQTGVAGNPHSYYRREDILEWADEWGVATTPGPGSEAFERNYLDAVLRIGRGGTDVFGLRLMWGTLGELVERLAVLFPDASNQPARLAQAFGAPLYVHLSRRGKAAQAVSRLKAEQGGLWHRNADGSERERTAPPTPEVYDGDRLAAIFAELEADDAAWNAWFDRHGIAPLRLVYEELSADPRAALASMLDALGLDPALAAKTERKTARLADETSREWTARLRADLGHRPSRS